MNKTTYFCSLSGFWLIVISVAYLVGGPLLEEFIAQWGGSRRDVNIVYVVLVVISYKYAQKKTRQRFNTKEA